MGGWLSRIRGHLVSKLILILGLTLLVMVSVWSYFNNRYQQRTTMTNLAAEADRLSNTIKLGAHYAMMINSREDIAEIIRNVSRQPEIKNIRIYNKEGQITYSDDANEIGRQTNIKAEACYVCHRSDPPLVNIALEDRTRVFRAPDGTRRLGILSAIYNEPGCASPACHVHPQDKSVLGALDMVLTLEPADRELAHFRQRSLALSGLMLLLTAAAVMIFILRFVNRPVARMIAGTRQIAQGNYDLDLKVRQEDEMGLLAEAISSMAREIGRNQADLQLQQAEYQTLFETVPCIITVQDRDYRLINYNRVFADKFDPLPGDFCYHAYKGHESKCESCPVERTFAEGKSCQSEETGYNRDGTLSHWLVMTSPIFDENGQVIAAMEINLDVTERKHLEQELEKSEQKYHSIFNSIPNPVFVLDPETLDILDCNQSMSTVYGYDKSEVVGQHFIDIFEPGQNNGLADLIKSNSMIDRARHRHKDGRRIYVNIRVSPSEFHGERVLLATTSDITKRLEAEEQLAQAGKMALLGEMATGVAHELNQPLSVIKTVSSFFIKKINSGQPLDPETLNTMLGKVDSNVDRATKIITHMRTFARKSEIKFSRVQINDVLERAFDIFSQQLKVHGIEVERDFAPDLPMILVDPDRLEQVFINLLINARDAVEERWSGREYGPGDKKITVRTVLSNGMVRVDVEDTGPGVDESFRDKIFDPFFTTKEVGKGTGLGLAISYGIVKECHGDIRVERRAGPGAVFVISFPVGDDEHGAEDNTAG